MLSGENKTIKVAPRAGDAEPNPYQASNVAEENRVPPRMEAVAGVYRPLAQKAKMLAAFEFVRIIFLTLYVIEWVAADYSPIWPSEEFPGLYDFIEQAFTPIHWLCFGALLLTLRAATWNARAFVHTEGGFHGVLGLTPTAMIYWFFIPIMNLYRPCKAVQSVWGASKPTGERARADDSLPMIWWSLWLLSGGANKVDHYLPWSEFSKAMLVNLLSILSAIFTILLVAGLEKMQNARALELYAEADSTGAT